MLTEKVYKSNVEVFAVACTYVLLVKFLMTCVAN